MTEVRSAATEAVWWNVMFTAHLEREQLYRSYGIVVFLCGYHASSGDAGNSSRLGSSPLFYIPCRRCVAGAKRRGWLPAEWRPEQWL